MRVAIIITKGIFFKSQISHLPLFQFYLIQDKDKDMIQDKENDFTIKFAHFSS
jgi:hypothetical protein